MRAPTSMTHRIRRLSPLAGATALSLATSLVLALVYARVAGAQALGVYHLSLALVALAGLLCLPGASTAVARAAAQGRMTAWSLFRLRLPRCLVASALALLAAGGLALRGDAVIAAAVTAAALTLPLFIGADVAGAQLLGVRDYRGYLRYQGVLQVLPATATVAAVAAAPAHPWAAVGAFTASTGLVQVGWLRASARGPSLHEADERYARDLGRITVLSVVDARLDVLLTAALLGVRDVGLLAIARTVGMLIKHVWTVLYQPVFAGLAAVSVREASAQARRYRPMVLAGLLIPGAIGVILAPFAVPVVFGDEFRPAIGVSQLLITGHALVALGAVEAVLLKAQGFIPELTRLYVVLPLSSVALLLVLVPSLGLVGVGIKAVAVALIHSAGAIILSRRALRRSATGPVATAVGADMGRGRDLTAGHRPQIRSDR